MATRRAKRYHGAMAAPSPLVRPALATLALFSLSATGPAPAYLDVSVAGQRSERGLWRACLTRDPAHFPDCADDPAAVSASFPARQASFRLGPVAPGTWALSVFHDENGNGKLDTVLGVPKEGFAFSRNPPLTFGPPKFERVSIAVDGAGASVPVRLRYLL
jgi:uncharacterized protein (DUF2141 family)